MSPLDISLHSSNQNLAPSLADSLKRVESKVQDDLTNFKFYPVVTVSVSYRF